MSTTAKMPAIEGGGGRKTPKRQPTKKKIIPKNSKPLTLADYEREARKLNIALSKDGHKKTIKQLRSAIAYQKSKK